MSNMAFDRSWIDKFEAGGDHVAQAIRGLTRDDLLAAPPAGENIGKWTIQQVVLHLADSEEVHADRMKRVIAEENPTLLAFDENKWQANLYVNEQSAEDAAKLIEVTRKLMVAILRKLPDAAFERSGMHTERGKVTLSDLIIGSAKHLEHHVKFIHAKRAAMGKEMW